MSKADLDEFGAEAEWSTIYDPKSFYPSRFEWLFSHILGGLLQGCPPKDHEKQISKAIHLATKAEQALNENAPEGD